MRRNNWAESRIFRTPTHSSVSLSWRRLSTQKEASVLSFNPIYTERNVRPISRSPQLSEARPEGKNAFKRKHVTPTHKPCNCQKPV
eukprot:747579-Pelagomonas_calceolata.AAC.1